MLGQMWTAGMLAVEKNDVKQHVVHLKTHRQMVRSKHASKPNLLLWLNVELSEKWVTSDEDTSSWSRLVDQKKNESSSMFGLTI